MKFTCFIRKKSSLLFKKLNFRLFSYNLNYLNCLINELIGNGKGHWVASSHGWLRTISSLLFAFNIKSLNEDKKSRILFHPLNINKSSLILTFSCAIWISHLNFHPRRFMWVSTMLLENIMFCVGNCHLQSITQKKFLKRSRNASINLDYFVNVIEYALMML